MTSGRSRLRVVARFMAWPLSLGAVAFLIAWAAQAAIVGRWTW